jgi:hypothetical protein
MNQENEKKMKLCKKCNNNYPEDDYYEQYNHTCKYCCRIYAKSRYVKTKKPKKEVPLNLTCKVCDINFPIDNFYKNHRRCKKCFRNSVVAKSTKVSQSEKNNIAKNVLLGKIKKLNIKYEDICKLQNDQEILNQASV